jgi:hypothetical protein
MKVCSVIGKCTECCNQVSVQTLRKSSDMGGFQKMERNCQNKWIDNASYKNGLKNRGNSSTDQNMD